MDGRTLGFDVGQGDLIWDLYRGGESLAEIARILGVTLPRVRRFLRESGGIRPVPRSRRASHLAVTEREEISRGIAAGHSARAIAERLGRSPSTVSREIARNWRRGGYRAVDADAAAYVNARRPKIPVLRSRMVLREIVTAKLGEQWSPQQIAAWLRREYPDDPQMGSRTRHSTGASTFQRGRCSPERCSTNSALDGRSAAHGGRTARTGAGESGTWSPSIGAVPQRTVAVSQGIWKVTWCLDVGLRRSRPSWTDAPVTCTSWRCRTDTGPRRWRMH
jgi:transposase